MTSDISGSIFIQVKYQFFFLINKGRKSLDKINIKLLDFSDKLSNFINKQVYILAN